MLLPYDKGSGPGRPELRGGLAAHYCVVVGAARTGTPGRWAVLSIHGASSRMVVKHKGAAVPSVVACTLLPYDRLWDFGPTLAGARGSVPLNHPHCAKFCVLGGAACSA